MIEIGTVTHRLYVEAHVAPQFCTHSVNYNNDGCAWLAQHLGQYTQLTVEYVHLAYSPDCVLAFWALRTIIAVVNAAV